MKIISIFKEWKCRCSSLGNILTSQPKKITPEQLIEIKNLENEKDNGINANGNKVKWTDTKQKKLDSLYKIKEAKDELSSGIKTWLDKEYNHVKYKRRKILINDDLIKGTIVETETLKLCNKVYKDRGYFKNSTQYENAFITGEPDVVEDIVVDGKSNRDKDTFDKAELTSLYKWQVRGYIWLLLKKLKTNKGKLIYGLVNAPYHQVANAITSLYYKLGLPDDDDEDFIKLKQQLERNMIVDIDAFKEDRPGYDFENTILDFSIHPTLRVKSFDVELETDHITFIKNRVIMCREYLVNKEQKDLEKIKQYENGSK